jgi:hypothetical protein
VFQEQGLVIVMQVEALQNGGAGTFVRVRNVDSGVVSRQGSAGRHDPRGELICDDPYVHLPVGG